MTMALLAILNNKPQNDNANLLIRAIATIVLSFITVDCCLVSRFKDLVEMAQQNGHGSNGDDNFEPNIQRIRLILDE